MDLPRYFMADLPPEASLSAALVAEACATLKRNRVQYLAPRSTTAVISLLSHLAEDWLDASFPFRQMALDQGPAATGFSRGTLAAGLDALFAQLTPDNLQSLVLHQLGHVRRLDELVPDAQLVIPRTASLATGPELIVHITSSTIPVPAILNLVLGVLVRSSQFVKCAPGESLLPRLFAHSLYQREPKLGACLEIAETPAGPVCWEDPLYAGADCVTAYATADTLEELDRRIPRGVKFFSFPQKLSFGYITRESLSVRMAPEMAARAAADVAAWDQLSSVSPHLFYVEHGGEVTPEPFAELLATELQRLELSQPRGRIGEPETRSITSKRDFYQVRAVHGCDTKVWCSPDSTAWTVVYEADASFSISSLHRFVYVKGVSGLDQALQGAASVQGKVSTVGLGARNERAPELATQLGRWGASRVCPVGRMHVPLVTSRPHDRPALSDLVTCTEWEMPS